MTNMNNDNIEYKEMVVANAEDYIGKRLTYDELVELFPDRWVGVSNPEWEGPGYGGTLVSGVLEFVCVDSEKSSKKHDLHVKGIKTVTFRTIEPLGGVLLW